MVKKRLLFLYLTLLTVFPCLSCDRGEKLDKVNFQDTVELKEDRDSAAPQINVCVSSMIIPEEAYYYKRLMDYVGQRLNMKVNFLEKKDYTEVNTLLGKGSIDMAFVGAGPYVEGHDKFGLELLVAPVVYGKAGYHSYIIVSQDSGIEKLEGLRGKVFAYVDSLSNAGRWFPLYMLQKMGENPKSFFKKTVYSYSHSKAIKMVATNIVDGAAVDNLIWEYMDKKGSEYAKKTKIIKKSEPYGIPPVVVRPDLDANLKIRLKAILLNMHKEKEGMAILKEMFIDRFIEVEDSLYDSIREIRVQLRNLDRL